MASRFVKVSSAVVGVVLLTVGVIYASLALTEGAPARPHPFFAQAERAPLVIAHRGGAGLWPENTLHAFERAAELGVDVIELDVRASADGAVVAFHDATLGRTTEGSGVVSAMTLAELKRLDAGHRWTADAGKTFPFRGRGLTVPTLAEVFDRLPAMRFNIEPKQESPSIVRPLCALIRERRMEARVLVGSFRQSVLEEFRRECPEVATSAGPPEASKFLAMYKAGVAGAFSPSMQAMQVPEYAGGLQVLSRGFVEAAHGRNLQVHAWTVNDEAAMRRMIDFGVDGIMTDYPDRLMALVGRGK